MAKGLLSLNGDARWAQVYGCSRRMLVSKKRDVQFEMWFVIAVFLVAFGIEIFRDPSKLPGITMDAVFVFVLFRAARVGDRRKNARG